MFSWLKNLKKGGGLIAPADGNSASGKPQTRVVKRIVPASLREAEQAEAALQSPAGENVHAAASAPTIALMPAAPSRGVVTARVQPPAMIKFPGGAPAATAVLEAPPEFEVPEPVEEIAAEVAPELAYEEQAWEEPPAPVTPPPKLSPIRLSSNGRSAAERPPLPQIPTTAKQIILTINDFVGRIPGHFINEGALDHSTEVHFDAADLYSDMSKGKATVPLSIIAENVPALFKRLLSPEEDIEIQLPLAKIVGQMSEYLTRPDQEEAETFEEIDTPFRKAALRDGAAHQVAAPAPPAAEAPTLAMPPETFRPRAKVNFNAAPAEEEPARPPAVQRVVPGAPPARKPSSGRPDERRVTVRVRPLIQALPIKQRESLLGSIPEDCQVDLPLSEIEEQLPSGRVVLPFATFAAALKPELRSTFTDNYSGEDVPISLSEIVRNLPDAALYCRRDQVVETVDPNEFETPFNTTPNEMPRPAVSVRPAVGTPPVTAATLRQKPAITPSLPPSVSYTTRKLKADTSYPSPMHAALGTREALDAKKVVKLAAGLPGVAGMTIITNDGLSLAGNLPAFMNPEGFTAMAPQLLRKLTGQVAEMKLGELQHLTLYTETHTVTLVTSGGMTLAVLHQNQADLGHGVREKLIAIICELARQYAG